jgi:hypothetical protein
VGGQVAVAVAVFEPCRSICTSSTQVLLQLWQAQRQHWRHIRQVPWPAAGGAGACAARQLTARCMRPL